VRLTPKGGRDTVVGWTAVEGKFHLKARVAALPEDGNANKALIGLLAQSLSVAKSSIRIASGETSRLKIIDIDGNVQQLTARLEAFGGGQ
jgi:uncharacterized protein YggU (UPF0235/DUF167 family)